MTKKDLGSKRPVKLYQMLIIMLLVLLSLSLIFSILCFTLFGVFGGGIGLLILFIILIILTYVLFAQYTNFFPLNDIKQYAFKPAEHLTCIGEGKYEINFVNTGNGIWEILDAKKPFALDLKGYLFPKAYIMSFFVRQFSFPVINQHKLRLKCLGESVSVDPKYKEVNIVIHDKRRKSYKIIKNGKTVLKIYRGFINLTPFYMDAIGRYHNRLRTHMKIDEEIYFYEKQRK